VAAIRPEWVFHLAAYGAYSSQTDVHRMVQTNIAGTVNLVEACLGTGCEVIVNTGSSSEYGFTDHAPAETEREAPNSHYAVTKVAATQYCRFTAQSRGIHLPTLRLYSVYGPYEEPTRLMPTLIVHGLRGELQPLVDPTIARDYVSIDDVCAAYLLAATRPTSEPGAIYNVGTGVQTSLGELVALARTILPIATEPVWGSMPNRAWDSTVWVADNRKIRDALGWHPRYSLDQGFRRMVEWFQDNRDALAYYERSTT
jgi:dolichol-phosphate mannosyltransferase